MKSLSRLKAALCVPLLIPLMGVAAVEPAAVLPGDTVMCVSVLRPEKLLALADHPVSKAVKLGGLKEVFGKGFAAFMNETQRKVWQEECGMPPEKLLLRFSGAFAAGVSARQEKTESKGKLVADMAAAVVFDGDDALATGIFNALARLNPVPESGDGEKSGSFAALLATKERTEEHSGTKLHIHISEKHPGGDFAALAWSVYDKMLFTSTRVELLHDMLERAAGGKAGSSLVQSGFWKTACESTGDPDAVAALDFSAFVNLFRDAKRDDSFLEVFHKTGMDKFQVIAAGVRSTTAFIDVNWSVSWETPPAFLKMFPHGTGVEAPAFLPRDLRGITWMPLDLKGMARGILQVVPEVTPMSTDQIQSSLDSMKTAFGVDVEKEIIARLGTGYFQADHGFEEVTLKDFEEAGETGRLINIAAPQKEGSVIGFRLADGKAVDDSLRALLSKGFKSKIKLDAREYMGFKIHRVLTASPPRPSGDEGEKTDAPKLPRPPECTFVVADDWLLIATGRQELLERILGLIRNPSSDNLWKRPEVQRGLDSLPAGGDYTRFDDVNDSGRTLILVFQSLAQNFPGLSSLQDLETSDLLKGVEFPIHHFGKIFIEPRAMRGVSRYTVRPD